MDDFTGIVHNVFLELYTELNLESIELFQMNDEQYGHIVCALPEKKIQEQTINSLYGFLKGKTFKLPVFIRDKAAMYVGVVKDNMTDEDKIEFTEKILILQNVAAIGNFSDSLAASYKVMEEYFCLTVWQHVRNPYRVLWEKLLNYIRIRESRPLRIYMTIPQDYGMTLIFQV